MFTGIIEKTASILHFERDQDSARLSIQNPWGGTTDPVTPGESIAVNGVCLTALESVSQTELPFHISSESLAKTQLGWMEKGMLANLERAMKPTSRLSGHWVQGHVDGIGHVANINPTGSNQELQVRIPGDLFKYCVEKGSITLNGVSLTINRLELSPQRDCLISLMIIPFTWSHTQFHRLNIGDPLNVEVDVLAKYVERICQPYQKPSSI